MKKGEINEDVCSRQVFLQKYDDNCRSGSFTKFNHHGRQYDGHIDAGKLWRNSIVRFLFSQ